MAYRHCYPVLPRIWLKKPGIGQQSMSWKWWWFVLTGTFHKKLVPLHFRHSEWLKRERKRKMLILIGIICPEVIVLDEPEVPATLSQ